MKRERRIQNTIRHINKQVKRWNRVSLPGNELAGGFFKKRKALACGCSKHAHGNPKINVGICEDVFRAAVVERIRGRRLEKRLLSVVDFDDFEF